MTFDWDQAKAATNLAKHGVAFELAKEVWLDPLHVIVPDRIVEGEQRWHAIGVVRAVLLLVVAHANRDGDNEEHIRIISARRATPSERRTYEED